MLKILSEFWKALKSFWNDNLMGNVKKISAGIGTFIATGVDLFAPVVMFYTSQIPIPVWGNFLFGIYVAFCVIITSSIMKIMKNGYHVESSSS